MSSSISQHSVSPMNCTCRAMLTFYLHDWDLIKMTHSRSSYLKMLLQYLVECESGEGRVGKAGNREGVWGEEGCGKERRKGSVGGRGER